MEEDSTSQLNAVNDRERDQASEMLQTAYAEDRLALDELEARLDRVARATSRVDVEGALDGVGPPGWMALVRVPGRSSGALVAAGAPSLARLDDPVERIEAVLASTSRGGPMRLPPRLKVRALLGNVDLDLREAVLDGDVDLHAEAVLGAVTVVVPPGMRVEVRGRALLGSFEHLSPRAWWRFGREPHRLQARGPDDQGPVLRVHGSAVLGSVEVLDPTALR